MTFTALKRRSISVTGTATMDQMTGSFRDSPELTRPLWSWVVGESLNLLSIMHNAIDFKTFPKFSAPLLQKLIKGLQWETNENKQSDKEYHIPTLQSYFNAVPRINFVSEEVFAKISFNKGVKSENEYISTDKNHFSSQSKIILPSDSNCKNDYDFMFKTDDNDSVHWPNGGNSINDFDMLANRDAQRIVCELDYDPVFELSQHLNSMCNSSCQIQVRQTKVSKVGSRNKNIIYDDDIGFEMSPPEKYENDNIHDHNFNDESENSDNDINDDFDQDKIVKLKLKSNEYIRKDFDLFNSNRLLLFDPYGGPPIYEKSLNTGLLSELLLSFGMKFNISKYKIKSKRLESTEIFCKNICLKDRKGAFFYIICDEDKNLDLKKAAKFLGAHRNLSFASAEEMKSLLRSDKGELNPFTLIYDHERKVRVILTTDMLLESHKMFNFHPFDPNLTLCLSLNDLEIFLSIFNHPLEYLPL